MLELSNTILIAIKNAGSFASDGDKKVTRKRSHKFENGIKEKKKPRVTAFKNRTTLVKFNSRYVKVKLAQLDDNIKLSWSKVSCDNSKQRLWEEFCFISKGQYLLKSKYAFQRCWFDSLESLVAFAHPVIIAVSFKKISWNLFCLRRIMMEKRGSSRLVVTIGLGLHRQIGRK